MWFKKRRKPLAPKSPPYPPAVAREIIASMWAEEHKCLTQLEHSGHRALDQQLMVRGIRARPPLRPPWWDKTIAACTMTLEQARELWILSRWERVAKRMERAAKLADGLYEKIQATRRKRAAQRMGARVLEKGKVRKRRNRPVSREEG